MLSPYRVLDLTDERGLPWPTPDVGTHTVVGRPVQGEST